MDKRELQLKQKELRAAMHEANEKNEVDNFDKLAREYREVCADLQKIGLDELASVIERNKKTTVDTNKALHDVMRQVRTNGGTATYTLQREITSGVITDGDTNNMESAGIPLSIKSLINPLELPTIYQSVGITIQTGVRGNIVWPCLNTIAEVDVAGETVELEDKSLDFSKITAVPQRLGLTITVTNEAIDDASFDLEGVITAQIQAALARVINTAVVGDSGVGQLVGPFANGDVESVTLTT
ncbi:MAG: phage major capsid protein, partial [Prevotellaceae bacterium]|nr:phage major capsid protein [Prevotellaceae bacterium]